MKNLRVVLRACSPISFLILAASSLAVITGCSALKASPAKPSGFLPSMAVLTEMRDRAPFHGLWYKDKARFAEVKQQRKQVVIKPVNTQYVEMRIRERAPNEKAIQRRIEDVREVARYMEDRFKTALRGYPKHPFTVVDQSTPDALILELAIVEVTPTNPVVNAVGTAAGTFIPGAGLISVAGKGSIAIEGIIRDGATNEVLVEFKDRESDKRAPFTVKDFQQYAHVRSAIDDWADQYAELSATPLDHQVAESLPFTLLPF